MIYQYVFGYAIVKLGIVCEIKTGKCLTKSDCVENGKYKIISGGTDIMGMTDMYNRHENTVTVARAGTAGYVDYQTEKFWVNDKCFSVIPVDGIDLNPKYLYYYLKNKEQEIMGLQSTGSVPTINTQMLASVTITIPCIDIQNEIVIKLDSFDTMVNGLTSGLPAEIKARHQQYEYYRDKLLTFDRIN